MSFDRWGALMQNSRTYSISLPASLGLFRSPFSSRVPWPTRLTENNAGRPCETAQSTVTHHHFYYQIRAIADCIRPPAIAMPVEAAAALNALTSASNALLTLYKHGLHYKEIPAEVEQLRHAIRNLETSIQTSKRLRRQKSRYLDHLIKTEVDDTVKRSQDVLDNICQTIEGCRADIDTKGTVSVKNRLDWMFRGHGQFMSQGMTLNSCVTLLGTQITRMDNTCAPLETPPNYDDSMAPEQNLRPPAVRGAERKRGRKLSSQSSLGNLSLLSFRNPNSSHVDEKEVCGFLPTIGRGSFSDEKEVVVTKRFSADETASIYSYDSSISASMSFPPDLGCTGDYCTSDSRPNHSRPSQNIQNGADDNLRTMSLGSYPSTSTFRYSLSESDATLLGSSVSLQTTGSQTEPRRRKVKSGYI